MCHNQSRRGFTLIELLVVIAIIALLVAILVPSLQSARKLAQKMTCQTHLKNIGTGLNMYMSENLDWFPPYYTSLTSTVYGRDYNWTWMDNLIPYCDATAKSTDGRGGVANWAYVGNQNFYPDMAKNLNSYGAVYSRVMNCPSQTGSGRMLHYGVGRDYNLNYRGPAPVLTPEADYKYQTVADVKNPSRYVYAFETSSSSCLDWKMTDAVATRIAAGTIHIGNCSNFMYAAGTVTSMTPKEIISYTPMSTIGFPFYVK